ncbi:MAG: DUF4190 domain-containing protein [Planctomycetes bacterium]|nr:DUF4190 domain-containing protein [Planctomycetota bacterium]
MTDLTTESESSYDADELGQYQSLSTSAVVALVLGLLSPIAFFSPLLAVVPGFVFAVALWALARIKGSEGRLLGTRLAYCGLVLAIVFGVASVTRTQIRVEILRRQANEIAEQWLSMLARGQAEEALGLMTSAAISKLRTPDEGDAMVPIATVPIFKAELGNAQLLRDPLAVTLMEMHQRGKETIFQSEGNQVVDLPKPRAVLYFKFPDFKFSDAKFSDAEAQDSLFMLSLVKTGRSPAVWLVETWKTEDVALP